MDYIYKQTVGDTTTYFQRGFKERKILSRNEAEAMVERGEAAIHKMSPGNRTRGPKSDSLLLPKRYKSAVLAKEAVGKMRFADFALKGITFEVVRCVGAVPDPNEFVLGERYNWRVRRGGRYDWHAKRYRRLNP